MKVESDIQEREGAEQGEGTSVRDIAPADANTVERREANACIALGAGVGGLGTAAGLLSGAVCPLCYIVAPGLVGVGLAKRYLLSRRQRKG